MTTEVDFAPSAVRLARHFLRQCICPSHGFGRLDEAQVVVSELVTNGIQHGAPPIAVTVECLGSEGTRVSVADGAASEVSMTSATPTDESGRGIMLVDYISRAWGTVPLPDGKQVWALV